MLTRTKLYRPPLPANWVPRPRLLERLRQQREHPLTLVSAPAGFGKSTLLAAWLTQCSWRSAWLSLDEGDNDLVTFVAYFVAAVQSVFPEFGTDTRPLLSAVSTPSWATFLGSLSNDLVKLDEPFLLVLDDYHLIHNPAIQDLLTELLRHPPLAWHLVVAARHDPPLPVNLLRARAAVSEIRSHDLRFSLEETLVFLRQTLDPQIDEAQAAILHQRTEGWAAGLRLAALSRPRGNGATALAAPSIHDVYVMDYLASEVLAQQPAALQDFLLKTSILDRLNGALSEAVAQPDAGGATGQTYLARLDELSLFVVPLDDRREWFRYHQLFRQLLQHQLAQRYTHDEIAALHQRASHWYAAHDLLEEAVQHALLAGDSKAAAQIVARQRHVLTNQDDWHRLELLLRVLPRSVVEAEPELILAQAWIAYNRFNLLQMPTLIDQAETVIVQQVSLPTVTRTWQGEVAFFRGYQAYWANDVSRVLECEQQALANLPLDWWHARVVARLFLASAHYMQGHPADATAALSAGLAEAQANGPHLMRSFLTTSFIYWYAGNLQAVADAADRVLALGAQHHYPQTINWARYFKGIVHYHRNQLGEAEQDLSAVVLDRYQTHMQCLVQSAIALAYTYQAQQQPDRALAVAEMMPTFLYETGNTILLSTLHAFQADLALKQGRVAEASQWAAQPPPEALSLMPHFFAQHLVLPKVLLAQNSPAGCAAAAQLLDQVSEFARSRHHTHVLLEALVIQAALFERQGDHPAALAALKHAIELAHPGGFVRLFSESEWALQPLLQELYDQGIAPHFVAHILAAQITHHPIGVAGSDRAGAPIEPLTDRESEVLALLAQHLSTKEIAARLFIAPNTAKRHRRHIYRKLRVNTHRDAIATAQRLGLLVDQK